VREAQRRYVLEIYAVELRTVAEEPAFQCRHVEKIKVQIYRFIRVDLLHGQKHDLGAPLLVVAVRWRRWRWGWGQEGGRKKRGAVITYFIITMTMPMTKALTTSRKRGETYITIQLYAL
jgi:hypothetical protein